MPERAVGSFSIEIKIKGIGVARWHQSNDNLTYQAQDEDDMQLKGPSI